MIIIERDSNGLVKTPTVDYHFNESGFIDWRKMIKQEFLVPNKEKTSETDVTKIPDSHLIILLGGIKHLAQIRGFTDISYEVTSPSSDYVVAVCKINWIANFETENRPVSFSAIGDASPFSTSGFAKNFLGPIAENRSFVRCVRNFLRINIVAQEELAPPSSQRDKESSAEKVMSPHSILLEVMEEKGISFDKLKSKLQKEGFEGADGISSVYDIQKSKVFVLIERLNKVKSVK
jgi:hypothetical protein